MYGDKKIFSINQNECLLFIYKYVYTDKCIFHLFISLFCLILEKITGPHYVRNSCGGRGKYILYIFLMFNLYLYTV